MRQALFSLLLGCFAGCNPTLRVYNCDAYYEHGEASEVELGEPGNSSPTAEERARVVSELGQAINSRKEEGAQ